METPNVPAEWDKWTNEQRQYWWGEILHGIAADAYEEARLGKIGMSFVDFLNRLILPRWAEECMRFFMNTYQPLAIDTLQPPEPETLPSAGSPPPDPVSRPRE